MLKGPETEDARTLPGEPRPDEIATRQFSWHLNGMHPKEVRRALVELAASLDRSRAAHTRELLEYRALERSLGEASAAIQALRQQLAAAQAELGASLNRQRALKRELLAARARALRGGAADPDANVARPDARATAIMEAARAAALEALRTARAAAQAIRRSADGVPLGEGRNGDGRAG